MAGEEKTRENGNRLIGFIRGSASAIWSFIRYDNMKDWLPRMWGRKFLLKAVALSLLAGVLASFFLYWLSRDLPTPSELTRIEQSHVTRVYDTNGVLLKEFYVQQREPVALNRIPRHLKEALLAVEDREFYSHWGINLRRFAVAIMANIRNLDFGQGASTITQQLARNLFENIGSKKTITRKLREQLTAVALERSYSKDEILEMFLNQVYFANGAYGIQQAAQNYFGKDVEALDLLESAHLVGILQLPFFYYNNPDRALSRRNLVLQYMVNGGYLDAATADTLSLKQLVFAEKAEEIPSAPYFVEWIRQDMERKYGADILYRDGATIQTTLDWEMQALAEKYLMAMLAEKQATYDRWVIEPVIREILENTPEGEEPDTSSVEILRKGYRLQGAFIAMDPQNGNILAMIGGRDFQENQYNNATQAKRQAGSSFKPFLYTAALDNGYTPATRVMNQPITIPQPDGSRWTPENYYGRFSEPLPLREALRRSINLVAARLVMGGGMGQHGSMSPAILVRYAKQFGITTQLRPYPSLAIGSSEVILLEMVRAFTVFANLGTRAEARMIRYVRDRFGRDIEVPPVKLTKVLEPELAYLMVDMMKGILEEGGTAGLARSYYNVDVPAAGKTGTTNDFSDAWFIGYTKHVVAGVWIGFETRQSMMLPEGRAVTGVPDPSGAVMAMPVWARFIRDLYKDEERDLSREDWVRPAGIVEVELCRTSPTLDSQDYKLALPTCPDRFTEIFLATNQPTETCTEHDPRYRRDYRIPPHN